MLSYNWIYIYGAAANCGSFSRLAWHWGSNINWKQKSLWLLGILLIYFCVRNEALNVWYSKSSTENTFEVVLPRKWIPCFAIFVSVLHQGRSTINIWYCYIIAFWYSNVKTFCHFVFFKMRKVWCYEWVLCILFLIFMLCLML